MSVPRKPAVSVPFSASFTHPLEGMDPRGLRSVGKNKSSKNLCEWLSKERAEKIQCEESSLYRYLLSLRATRSYVLQT